MDAVRTIGVDRRSLGSDQIQRSNKAYAFLLGVCRLLHDSLSVDSKTGQVRFAGVPEEHLFEAFVRALYRRELVGWEVSRPRLRGTRIIMDAKYYEDASQVRHGRGPCARGHPYQIVSYTRRERHRVDRPS